MFGIGGFEFFIIILFGLLIFGPDKMPQIGRTIGRTMRQFQKVQDDMKQVITAEMYAKDPEKDTSPFKPKETVLDKIKKEGTTSDAKPEGAQSAADEKPLVSSGLKTEADNTDDTDTAAESLEATKPAKTKESRSKANEETAPGVSVADSLYGLVDDPSDGPTSQKDKGEEGKAGE